MPTTSPPRTTFSGGLMTLIRQQAQYYRPLPLGAFPRLTLAPDSTHKFDSGRRGGNFAIQPAFIHKAGGIVFRNPEGDYFGLIVDAEERTLLIERLHPHKADTLILKSRPEETPHTVSLSRAAVTRYPVGKNLRVIVLFQRGKPAIHFFNKLQEPMDVALFRANADAALAEELNAADQASDPHATASRMALVWRAARLATSRFNSTVIFFATALVMVLAALIVQFAYVHEFSRQVRGEPYAVDLDRQHLNVQFNDASAHKALSSKSLSYPIYQALTFAGRRHSGTVQAISAADAPPPDTDAVDVAVSHQGGEARTFRIHPQNPAEVRALQDYIFGGDFERAQTDAVAVPSILSTFLLVTFLAAGLFLAWGVWQLWSKVAEITAGERVHEDVRTHKIIAGLDADAQRNIGEKLGPDSDVQQVLQEVDDFGEIKARRQEEQDPRSTRRRSE